MLEKIQLSFRIRTQGFLAFKQCAFFLSVKVSLSILVFALASSSGCKLLDWIPDASNVDYGMGHSDKIMIL